MTLKPEHKATMLSQKPGLRYEKTSKRFGSGLQRPIPRSRDVPTMTLMKFRDGHRETTTMTPRNSRCQPCRERCRWPASQV